MRFIKLAAVSFIILFVLVTCLGFLFPSHVIVSRAVDINASADRITKYTNNFAGWKNWVETFKNENIIHNNETKIGNNIIRILTKNDDKVTGEWVGKSGNKQSFSLQVISSNINKSIVQWQFEENIKWYPWERFTSMINDKVIGEALERNLDNLKKLVEVKGNQE